MTKHEARKWRTQVRRAYQARRFGDALYLISLFEEAQDRFGMWLIGARYYLVEHETGGVVR